MLQDCQHLDDCERILRSSLARVELVGEVPLLPKDVRILRNMFLDALSPGKSRGTALLQSHYPCSLASYLVAVGVYGYKNGDYWSSLEESVGKLGSRFRGKWANFFLSFCQKRGFPLFSADQVQALPAILGHGGIPESCLENFFSEVVLPLWSREVSLPGEAVFELSLLRENQARWQGIRQKLAWLEEKEAGIRVKIAGIRSQVFQLARYRELQPLVDKLKLQGLPRDFNEFKEALDRELASLKKEKESLSAKKELLKRKVESFSKNEQKIIDHADDLVASIKEYQKLKKTLRGFYKLQKEEEKLFRELEGEAAAILRGGWDLEYGDALRRVDLFELEHRVAELEELKPAEEEGAKPGPGKRRGKGKGLVLLSLGFLLAGFLAPSIAGIASAALGFTGIATWFYFIQKGRRTRTEVPDPKALYREALKGVRNSLQGLPLKTEVLEASPLDYLQKLGNLKEIHEEFCMRREHVRELKRHITSQERTIRETAVGFSGGIPVTLDDSLPVLMQSLSRARTRKSETQKAARELEKVNGTLRAKTAREEELYREMETAVKKIEALGAGDFMKGMDLLEEGRRAEREVENLERQLFVRNGESAGKKREILIKRYRMAKRQLELCRRLLTKAENEFTRHGPTFPVTVEEPVQKYLLYGGKGAEEFFTQSLKAVEDMVDWGRISDNSRLPHRVKDFLRQWWEDRFQEELPARAYEAPGSPYLLLSEAGEVRLGLPPQTLQIPEGTSRVVARMDDGRVHYPVHCRSLGDDWAETLPATFRLPFVGRAFHVTLAAGSRILSSWKVQPSHPFSPYLAFDERGRQILLPELPRQKVRLLLWDGYKLEAGSGLLGEQEVPGCEGCHTLYYLDLAAAGDGELLAVKGEEKKLIPLQGPEVLRPKLRGGQLLAGLWLENRELYTAPPLALRLPLLSERDTENWSLSLVKLDSPDGEGRHFKLKDLLYITDIQEEVAEVPLIHENLLGRSPRGLYALRARHTRLGEEFFKFAVFSNLSVEFNRSVYAPCEELSHAAVNLTLPGVYDVHVMPPVEMEKVGLDLFRLCTLVEEEALVARVQTEKDSREMYLRLELPRLRWRLRGKGLEEFSSWRQEGVEIWYGDLERAEEAWIEFSLPESCRGSLKSVLKSPLREEVGKVEKGFTRVNLKSFPSPARGEQTLTFALVRGKKKVLLSGVPVLKIIHSREVSGLRVRSESTAEGIIHLLVQWEEKGKALKKVRLWKFHKPWSPLLERTLEADQRELFLRADPTLLTPGNYLVEIGEEGPLTEREHNPFSSPEEKAPVKIFELKRGDPYVKQWMVKRKGQPNLLLAGKLKNVNRRKVNLEVIFLGLQEGEPFLRKDQVALKDKKSFKKKISLRKPAAHWLVLVLKEGGRVLNWSAHVIPEGDDLTWPLEEWKSKMLGEEILSHCQIRLDCQGEVSFSSLLEGDKGREILDLMKGARQCIRLNLDEKSAKNPKLVKREDGQIALEFEKGVRCMTCGEKISGQELWNKSHYPKCKSLVPNIETLPVSGTLIWPGDSTAKKLPRNLQFARELVSETLTLYTEKNASVAKVMEGIIREGEYLRQGVQALLSKEKQVFLELHNWNEAVESLSSKEGDEPPGEE